MSKLIAELTATINALGYAAGGKTEYFVDNECKEAIRELIRFLRRDDGSHEIRRHIGYASILSLDLIPILINHHEDEEMLDLILRLLVNLTTPVLLLYNEETPTSLVARQQYMEILSHLQQYKQAFTKQQIWTVLSEKLSILLKMDWADRGEEKSLIIIRILILVRNVLHVPADADFEKRPDNDASMHDQVLWALHEGGMINLILYIATSETENQYYLHILEITSLMLRDQNAEVLANASVQRSLTEKQRDEQELIEVLKKEKEDKQKKMCKFLVSRNPRFSGTYVVKGVKSIGDHDLVVNSLDKEISTSLDRHKKKLKTPKNRMPMQSDSVERRSAFSVRVLMKEFCIEFLNGAYNFLMHYVREMIHRGKAQANDESYYFWSLRFFMEFNRHYKFEVKLISETMDVSIFHFTQERIEDWRGKLITDKKKVHLWSKRMHLGLKAYKEMLHTLLKMYQHADREVRESSHTMMSNIFYVVEYRELLMCLLNLFDEIKFSKDYLKDLIEANHVFMKMLDNFCKRHRSIVVQKKAKVTHRKKPAKKSAPPAILEPKEDKWTELEVRILDIFENNVVLDAEPIPFDATSDTPFEEQKVEAMRKIRYLLLKAEIEEAIPLFRACREVWPENNVFGEANMSSREECSALREIYFADIGQPNGVLNRADHSEENAVDADERSDDENDGSAAAISVSEQNFQFMDFVKKFAKPKIAHACCLLLSQFEKNATYTNHCILKLLHRITFDCKYAAILFQASVFQTFQRILDSDKESHKELQKFAIFIIRKFTEVAKKNNKVYMELLFWKGNKEAYEIEEGYGSLSSSSGKVAWSEEQEDELQRLFAEYERDKPDEELVDWIHANLIDQSRSRRSLIQKLRELGLLQAAQRRAPAKIRPPREFSEQEIAQITELFNEFKAACAPLACIMERLEVQRPKKRIIDKIVELGLVQNRSELRKKRTRKSNRDRDDSNSEIESETDSDDSSDNRNQTSASSRTSVSSRYLSAEEVIRKVRETINLGMKESVEWIVSSLEDVIEDMDDDESDVPLLPLADFSIKAMDNSIFQSFLIAVGINPPSDDNQEMYWRIPGSWQANDLRERVTLIKSGMENNTVADSSNVFQENETDRSVLQNSQNENILSSNDTRLSEECSNNHGNTNSLETSKPETNNSSAETLLHRHKKRKRFDPNLFENSQRNHSRKRLKSHQHSNNDSDSNNSHQNMSSDNEKKGETHKARETSSDSDIPSSSSRAVDDKAENGGQRRPKKKRKIRRIRNNNSDSDGNNQSLPSDGENEEKTNKVIGTNSQDDSSASSRTVDSDQPKKKRKIRRILNDNSDSDENQQSISSDTRPGENAENESGFVENSVTLNTVSSDDSDGGIRGSIGRKVSKIVLMDSDSD